MAEPSNFGEGSPHRSYHQQQQALLVLRQFTSSCRSSSNSSM